MTQEPHKNNIVLILIAIIGVVGTVIAATITVIGNYNVEKMRQETELTRIALLSFATPVGATQAVLQNTLIASTELPAPTYTVEAINTIQVNNLTETSSPAVLSECKTIEIDVSKNSDNYDGNVIVTLEKIELCANNKMKWHISFWNKTDQDAGLAFGEDKSYVVDEFGVQYKILSSSPSNFIDSGVRAGIRLTGWLEFYTPENNAKEFSLHLVQWSFGSNQLKLNDPLEFSLTEPLVQK
jgi:hypothetical protein